MRFLGAALFIPAYQAFPSSRMQAGDQPLQSAVIPMPPQIIPGAVLLSSQQPAGHPALPTGDTPPSALHTPVFHSEVADMRSESEYRGEISRLKSEVQRLLLLVGQKDQLLLSADMRIRRLQEFAPKLRGGKQSRANRQSYELVDGSPGSLQAQPPPPPHHHQQLQHQQVPYVCHASIISWTRLDPIFVCVHAHTCVYASTYVSLAGVCVFLNWMCIHRICVVASVPACRCMGDIVLRLLKTSYDIVLRPYQRLKTSPDNLKQRRETP